MIAAAYSIYRITRISSGDSELKRINEQPNDGFKTNANAEKFLINCMRNKNLWIFQQDYLFTILKIYSNDSSKAITNSKT